MKLLKSFGSWLFFLGCIAAILGVLALILPQMDNAQVQKLINAFSEPSDHAVVRIVNAIMTYALGNCYMVMLTGAGLVMLGAAIMLFSRKPAEAGVSVAPQNTSPHGSEQSSESAYRVTDSDSDASEVKIWHSALSADTAESNPFADASLVAMLTPKSESRQAENPANPFAAPAAKPETGASAYKRPNDEQALNAGYTMPIIPAAPDTSASCTAITDNCKPALTEEAYSPRELAPIAGKRTDALGSPAGSVYAELERCAKPPIAPTAREASSSVIAPPHCTAATPYCPSSRTDEQHTSLEPKTRPKPAAVPLGGSSGIGRRSPHPKVQSMPDDKNGLHMSTPMLPPIAPSSEETLYRAPDYTPPASIERPRIRSTFRTPVGNEESDGSTVSAVPEDPVKPRIKVSMGRRS